MTRIFFRHLTQLALCLAPLAMAFSPARAAAAPMLDLDNLPSAYVPGGGISFLVTLTDAVGLAAFNVDVLVSGSGQPGVDYFVESVFPEPPAPGYVFGSSAAGKANFLHAVHIESGHLRVTLSDFHDPDGNFVLDPVNTVAGVNPVMAAIRIVTDASYAGPLAFSFDPTSLQLDDADINPIDGFDGVTAAVDGWSVTLTAVPEPATAAMLAFGFFGACKRWGTR